MVAARDRPSGSSRSSPSGVQCRGAAGARNSVRDRQFWRLRDVCVRRFRSRRRGHHSYAFRGLAGDALLLRTVRRAERALCRRHHRYVARNRTEDLACRVRPRSCEDRLGGGVRADFLEHACLAAAHRGPSRRCRGRMRACGVECPTSPPAPPPRKSRRPPAPAGPGPRPRPSPGSPARCRIRGSPGGRNHRGDPLRR